MKKSNQRDHRHRKQLRHHRRLKQLRQSQLILPLTCKYCKRRFFRENWARYRSHTKNHELRYSPYFYGKSNFKDPNNSTNNSENDLNNNIFSLMTQTVFGTPVMPLKSFMASDAEKPAEQSKAADQTRSSIWLGYNPEDFVHVPLPGAIKRSETKKDSTSQEPKRKRFRSYRQKLSKDTKLHFSKTATKKDAENPYNICLYCKKVFPKASSRKLHELIHTGLRPFKCNYCEKTFTQASNRNTHEAIHFGIEKSHKCKYCKKGFACSTKQKQHEKMHLVGVQPFKAKYTCEICSKTFASNSAIRKHYMIHTGEKPFSCRYCKKTFTQKGNRNIHELLHSGEKKFQCEICQKTFLRKQDVRLHSRIHSGEKPFKCRYCERGFTQGSHCKAHERMHNGEKPYACR